MEIYSHSGRFLITDSEDGTLKIWNASDGSLIHNVEVRTEGIADVSAIALSPDDRIIATACGVKVKLWDTSSGKLLQTLETNESQTYITGDISASVRIWSLKERKLIREFDARTGDVKSVVFSSDGRLIAAGGLNQNIQVWDAISGELIWELFK